MRVHCGAVIAFLCVFASAAPAADAKDIKGPPWHLVDLWWDLGRERPFQSYAIDVTIHDDVPADVNLYVAPIGIAHLSKTPFYGGLQTQADAHTKASRRIRKIGRGLLMSMWGERSLDAIRPSIGGFCQSSGHEGDFVSVRRGYEWTRGTYTYRVVRMDRQEADGNACTWVAALLYAHEKDENVFVGALRFPGDKLTLGRSVASFVEIYGRPIPPERIPKVTVTLGNLRVNGRAVRPEKVTAVYPENVPDYAEAVGKDGRVEVRVGRRVAGRASRRVRLLDEGADR